MAAELAVETYEMPQLVRLLARRLPADREVVREALCEATFTHETGARQQCLDIRRRGAILLGEIKRFRNLAASRRSHAVIVLLDVDQRDASPSHLRLMTFEGAELARQLR